MLDICRCMVNRCPYKEECLRYTCEAKENQNHFKHADIEWNEKTEKYDECECFVER